MRAAPCVKGVSSCGRHDKLRPPASTRVSAMDGLHLNVEAFPGYKGEKTPVVYAEGKTLHVNRSWTAGTATPTAIFASKPATGNGTSCGWTGRGLVGAHHARAPGRNNGGTCKKARRSGPSVILWESITRP